MDNKEQYMSGKAFLNTLLWHTLSIMGVSVNGDQCMGGWVDGCRCMWASWPSEGRAGIVQCMPHQHCEQKHYRSLLC